MKRVFAAAVAASALVWAASASAQMSAAPGGSRPSIGVFAGAGAVQKVGALLGGTLNFPVTEKIDVVVDGLWSQNAATRRRFDSATAVAAHIQATQGSPASGTIKAPSLYVGGGLRIPFLGERSWRPYVMFSGGIARVALRPQIILAGGDITAKLPQFGVTLGSDLTGVLTKAAFGGGFGVRSMRGAKSIDLGLRYINIQTDGQPTSLIGAGATIGFSL